MADGNNRKAIMPSGIVRNATKIGVQDGQAEDLINLRFMDGSWRASGNGRQIENMPTGTIYQQLYVHTNIYHHLLGVDNGTLYWFAEIDNDGVTFYPLDGTTDRSQWPEEMKDLPTERKALTTVTGSMWVTQTGHLLTIIDESDDFEFFVFKTGDDKYIEVNVDTNGKATSRSLYPFGQVHFNCYCPCDPKHIYGGKDVNAIYNWGIEVYYETIKSFIKEKNQFAQPFLVVAAIKLYDGSYLYASNPIYIHPRERLNMLMKNEDKGIINYPFFNFNDINSKVMLFDNNATIDRYLGQEEVKSGVTYIDEIASTQFPNVVPYGTGSDDAGKLRFDSFDYNDKQVECSFINYQSGGNVNNHYFWIAGSDLCISISEELRNIFTENKQVFDSFCIFITTESDLYKPLEKDIEDSGTIRRHKGTISFNSKTLKYKYHQGDTVTINTSFSSYSPVMREKSEIVNDLLNSPFYLLREYKVNELDKLLDNQIIDLSDSKYKNILKPENLVQQKTLSTEALSRTTYLPKVSYMYNGRLHIANYKTHPFLGYPIDLFHLHNHSVKVQDGAWFPADADGKRVLPNIADNNDAYLQYPRTNYEFTDDLSANPEYFAYIEVEMETAQGLQKVVRYIPSYAIAPTVDGRADFVESLNPLLTYPDARAKTMKIVVYKNSVEITVEGRVQWRHIGYIRNFPLTPHPYLNIAYHIDPDLKPISLGNQSSTLRIKVPQMQNTEEYFPNGLKVSKADQPMFFPVENTYQVGSAEILALMSNAIAVGTGQTGAAPLYVFCKDGVYALYVDASGEMVYKNARILARDVCNNARSVTPIDAGVVFTTDRGLMMIAGEQVQEIGAQAEGDVVQFWNAGSVDYSKIATASMQQIAGLPSELCSTTDFLTYLQDKGTSGKAAIINYNHNMRELMVSNPNYPYSYVLDREGNWSRRDYSAAQYVSNYPTSYRVDADGHFYKVDDEGDANTSLEHRKEADNKIFYLSNVIKLDSIGFKQAYRFVVRGYFETIFATQDMITDTIDGRKIIVMGLSIENMGVGEVLRMAYLNIYGVDGWVSVGEHGEVGNILTLEIYDALTSENITNTFRPAGFPSDYITLIKTVPAIGIVVEGSYDGRKFKPLGYNRKSGKFRDIGCIVERTDVRFFRICLSGQVTGKTRIDYMEVAFDPSILNTKIR